MKHQNITEILEQYPPEVLLAETRKQLAEKSLYEFIKQAWHVMEPGKNFVDNWHIEAICEHLEACNRREITRLIINIPPRHMKSILVNVAFPVWCWLQDPSIQFLSSSYALPLATRDNRKCRLLMQSPWFQTRWGLKFKMTGDQNQKQRYENDHSGYRLATSVDGALTGEGGDIIMIDDPHNVRDAVSAATISAVQNWWDEAMQSRHNDPKTGVFIIIMQRVNENDLTGHIIQNEYEDWDHLCLPAEYEKKTPFPVKSSLGFKDPRTKEGELLWPNRFGKPEIDRLKKVMGSYASAGQLQQRPSPRGGGILKSSWWQPWNIKDDDGRLLLPEFEYIMQSWDTGFSEKDTASYSARTTWGVFQHKGHYNVMILEMWRDRIEYPALRREAKEAYMEWQPDSILVEKKASGQSLIQDLRMANIPVIDYTPGRDKVARAHSSSPLLEAGMVWYPNRKWAKTVIDKCAAFPAGDGADIVDTCTQAWLRMKSMWLLPHPEDWEASDEVAPPRKRKALYG